jgi:hypothetical protein
MPSLNTVFKLLLAASPTIAQENSTTFFQYSGKPLEGDDLCDTNPICNQAYITTNNSDIFQPYDPQFSISRTKIENSSSENEGQKLDACLTLKMLGMFIETELKKNFSESLSLVTCNTSNNVRGWLLETQVTNMFSDSCFPLNTKVNSALKNCSFLKTNGENIKHKKDSMNTMIAVFIVIGAFVGAMCILGLVKEGLEDCARRNLSK